MKIHGHGQAAAGECVQGERLDNLDAGVVRVHKELYEGREGRQPVLVRLDGVERIVRAQTYVATALLIAALVGAAGIVTKAVLAVRVTGGEPHQYEPAARGMK